VTDWTAVAAVATATATMATSVSAALIAWQAKETRNTAGAARESVDVGRASVEVGQNVVTEAIKTRLDARAPKLTVTASSAKGEVARGRPLRDSGRLENAWPREREFRRTADDYKYLSLGAQFGVQNEGDRTVRVTVSGSIHWLRPNLNIAERISEDAVAVDLAPGDACEFRLEDGRPLHEWVEAWEGRRSGDNRHAIRPGRVSCSDPYDDGVIDQWTLEVVAYPVEPKPDDLAAWVLRPTINEPDGPPVVSAFVLPQQRRYYLSKIGDRELR
jgi:hypothetical protein